MNPFDILIVIIVGFCLIRGIFRGLIKELSSIVGVLGGFYAAYTYYPLLTGVLSRWVSNTAYQNILGFLIFFCAIFILISLLGLLIKYFMDIASLGWLDRVCGAIFGFIKGVLISAVLLVIFTTFLPKGTPLIRDSHLSPHVMMLSENLAKVVSKDMKRQFGVKIQSLKEAWNRGEFDKK